MQNVVFFLLAVFGGFGTWAMLLGPTIDVVRARRWTPTPCTITGSDVTSEEVPDPGRPATRPARLVHGVEVGFRYEAGGRTHVARRYSFDTGIRTSGRVHARQIAALYPAGRSATCWVNPGDPAEAVINRRFQGSMLLGLAPFLLFLVGVLALARPALREGRSSPEEDPAAPRHPPRATSARRRLGRPFENGLIVAVGYAGLALFGLLAAIGSEVSNPRLPRRPPRRRRAPRRGIPAAPVRACSAARGVRFLLVLGTAMASSRPGRARLPPLPPRGILSASSPAAADPLSSFPELAARYASEVAGPVWILPVVAVLVALGARRL